MGRIATALAMAAFVTTFMEHVALAAQEHELRQYYAAMHAMQADSIRKAGIEAATNLLSGSALTPKAADEWRTLLAGNLAADAPEIGLPSILAEDFLAGASILLGSCDHAGAVFAYWNPFWDVLLFVRTGGGELPRPEPKNIDGADGAEKSGGTVSAASLLGLAGAAPATGTRPSKAGRLPKVEQFLWVGGKAFRGDEAAAADGLSASYSERLWRRESGTVGRFRKIYPDSDGMGFSDGRVRLAPDIEAVSFEETRQAVRAAAYFRLKAIQACQRGNERLTKCLRAAEFLRCSDGDALVDAFDSYDTRPFCRRLGVMPARARMGFVPYGVFEDEGKSSDAMLLFVNAEMPRLYATAFFPDGILDKLDWPKYKVSLEWYDLAKAEELLGAAGGMALEADSEASR